MAITAAQKQARIEQAAKKCAKLHAQLSARNERAEYWHQKVEDAFTKVREHEAAADGLLAELEWAQRELEHRKAAPTVETSGHVIDGGAEVDATTCARTIEFSAPVRVLTQVTTDGHFS